MLETAIVGAGPYGLSLAAHFRHYGIPFRIFGRPMESWLMHMPKGMLLKSDGFASNLSDPAGAFTLKRFCAVRGIEYADAGVPVRLETFSEYGLTFQDRMVPGLENKLVVRIDQLPQGFCLRLDDGQTVNAKRVIMAVGISHFEHVPANLANLPAEFLTHSIRHHHLESFQGQKVIVIGGGSSAIDLAALLYENGIDVHLLARRTELKFHGRQEPGQRRSWWKRIRHPQSGLGPGLRSRFFADAPMCFHYLPERLRLELVRTHLGPAGGWFAKDKLIGRVPLLLGCTIERAEVHGEKVHLHLCLADGTKREIMADHVIAATGYKVDLERLEFLSPEIRSKIKQVSSAPILSSSFESSVRGLYFVGIVAAYSFGPLMKFAYGAAFAAKRITRTIMKAQAYKPARVPAHDVLTMTE